MSNFVKANLLLIFTLSLALISVNLIYRFYFVPKMVAGESGVLYELSIIPVGLAIFYWGTKTDSVRKFLSFPFIIAALTLSYTEMLIKFEFIGTSGFDGEHNVFNIGGIITLAIIFLVVLGIIRLGFLAVMAFFKEIQLISS